MQGGTGPKGGQQAIKMCFGTVLDHLDTILVHFQPKLKIGKFRDFDHFGPFWPLFGPFWTPKWPWEPQNGPKGGQQAIKMCFETVLHYLDAILVHFQPKREIGKFRDFDHFGPFWPLLSPIWTPK